MPGRGAGLIQIALQFSQIWLAHRKARRVPWRLFERVEPEWVFAITVYGYSASGRPAHFRDEFARYVPWNIAPVSVATPFEQMLEAL